MKPTHFAAIFIVGLFSSQLAFAKFTLCNRTSQDKLVVATGLTWYAQDQSTGERVIDAESMGWTTIAKGTCSVVIADFLGFDDVYFFAISSTNSSIKWTGKFNFCVDPKNTFDYLGRKRAQAPCPAGVPVGMIFIDTHGENDYQYSISDQQ